MKKSLLALGASIVTLLVWLVAVFQPSFIILTLPFEFLREISILLFVISFYLRLRELDKRQPGKSLWWTINKRRLPPFFLVASVLLFAINFVATAATGFETEISGNFGFLPYTSILLGITSVFLKLNDVDKGKVNNEHIQMPDTDTG